jgi:hypothetical protein
MCDVSRIVVLLLGLTVLLVVGCSAARPLHRSEASIRASLFKQTPLGSSKSAVIAKIGWHLDRSLGPFAAQSQEAEAMGMIPSSPVTQNVKSALEMNLGGYVIWFGTRYVYGVWGFDSEDRLVGIWVYKENDVL